MHIYIYIYIYIYACRKLIITAAKISLLINTPVYMYIYIYIILSNLQFTPESYTR